MRRALGSILLTAALAAACSSSGDNAEGTADSTSEATNDNSEPEPAASSGEEPTTDAGADDDADAPTANPVETATIDPEAFDPTPIEWDSYNSEVDIGLLDVPVNYAEPDGDTIELFVARYNAIDQDDKIGSLLVNPGGPGFGGSDFAVFAAQIFDRALLERFDIIGWDPRGTGQSEPAIDCIDDYDRYFFELDGSPETDEEREVLVERSQEFADECAERNADIIRFIGTNNSARDMNTIRRSLGEEQVTYFGFSYGSELGATWATLFPDTVRAAVLDGAADPNADSFESNKQQLAGFSGTLATFLAQCSADDSCAFHSNGDAETAFDELLTSLDGDPVPGSSGRPPVNRDVATTGVIQAMYSESLWSALEQSLAAAQNGDGAGLLSLADSYYQRQPDGTYGNELEAFQSISCADTNDRNTVEEADAEAVLLHEVSPRLVPANAAGGYFCTFFPTSVDPRVDVDTTGAGPIVVIGTTGDPATPFDSTVRMADALADGRLVIVDADEHTGYGLNACIVDVVNDYLIDLEAPDDGTECGPAT